MSLLAVSVVLGLLAVGIPVSQGVVQVFMGFFCVFVVVAGYPWLQSVVLWKG